MSKNTTKQSKAALGERQQRIFDFINSNRAGVIASVDADNQPHASVIYHVMDKTNFRISFLTKTGTKKYDNLIRNNHVVLVIFDPKTQTVAQVIGKVFETTDPDEINAIAETISETSLATSNNDVPPIAKLDAGDYTAFKLIPDQIRMASYSQPQSGDYDRIFESIESFEWSAAS